MKSLNMLNRDDKQNAKFNPIFNHECGDINICKQLASACKEYYYLLKVGYETLQMYDV